MAYDEALSDRVRTLLHGQPDLREVRMFGGLVFMVAEHMTCGVRRDELLVRVGEEQGATLIEQEGVRPMTFHRGPSASYLLVSPDQLTTKRQLERWLRRALEFTATLPAKGKGTAGRSRS